MATLPTSDSSEQRLDKLFNDGPDSTEGTTVHYRSRATYSLALCGEFAAKLAERTRSAVWVIIHRNHFYHFASTDAIATMRPQSEGFGR